MPIQATTTPRFDFEELFFYKDCNVDAILRAFFAKYRDVIIGDTEYITYKINRLITEDRNCLLHMRANQQDPFHRVGKTSYIQHPVIPEDNNGKEYYVYCIHTFL